jgi:hypothetical protein
MNYFIFLAKFLLAFWRLGRSNRTELINWNNRLFESPAPQFIKMQILASGDSPEVWIETGTYTGQTTKTLSASGSVVYSIEPSGELAEAASLKFENDKNVTIINDLSENILEELLENIVLDGKSTVSFWLDGHYSEGVTHRGPMETPIKKELEIISNFMNRFDSLTIYIDDFRCFVARMPDYPTPHFLSQWAESQTASWDVRHDIFIISKTNRGLLS